MSIFSSFAAMGVQGAGASNDVRIVGYTDGCVDRYSTACLRKGQVEPTSLAASAAVLEAVIDPTPGGRKASR